MSYTVVVAENNEELRKELVTFMKYNGFTIMAEAKSGKETKKYVQNLRPQVLFVDIKMPDGDGYAIAKELRLQIPDLRIVFITGTTEFAYQAYEIEAVDYVVKPFSHERLYQCFKRIDKSFEPSQTTRFLPRLSIRSRNIVEVIDQEEIIFISTENKSTQIMVAGKPTKEIRTLDSLKNMEEKLDPSIFLRTHKSYIINIKHISRIEPSGQTYVVFFKNTSKMAFVSRNYLSNLYKRLQID
ncbi:LytTR family DNA-binding domain-containing protein [Bacillus gobiensis]|uniref:LytR/AlgR family response regulator transcription factor n=1 Tax=Bacillus gobiensis TaxID=1441095 RepID=UPI003D222292